MRKSHFTETQIIGMIKEQEAGLTSRSLPQARHQTCAFLQVEGQVKRDGRVGCPTPEAA